MSEMQPMKKIALIIAAALMCAAMIWAAIAGYTDFVVKTFVIIGALLLAGLLPAQHLSKALLVSVPLQIAVSIIYSYQLSDALGIALLLAAHLMIAYLYRPSAHKLGMLSIVAANIFVQQNHSQPLDSQGLLTLTLCLNIVLLVQWLNHRFKLNIYGAKETP